MENEGFGMKGGVGTKCGRWNPTSEQVKVLTDLFRSGLRTPSTDQIQKISSQLSFYGKIESKNVFYWFQNHKARERQKRRRVFVDHQPDNNIFSSSSTQQDIMNNEVCSEPRETLQLFPLNSSGKFMLFANECNKLQEKKAFTNNYTCGGRQRGMITEPPLDLRLSFL